MNPGILSRACLAVTALLFAGSSAYATTAAMFDKEHTKPQKKEFSPYVNRGYPTHVYFGDTHLHTRLSVDAGTFGNRLGLDDAYRFTRGEEVTASQGLKHSWDVHWTSSLLLITPTPWVSSICWLRATRP